jgi:hypothetical protein
MAVYATWNFTEQYDFVVYSYSRPHHYAGEADLQGNGGYRLGDE